MPWQIIIVVIIAFPVILLPVALVWYLNRAGIYEVIRIVLGRRKTAQTKTVECTDKVEVQ